MTYCISSSVLPRIPMASRTQDEQQAILRALAVFDDNQTGMEGPNLLVSGCVVFASHSYSGQIDRARLRKLLIGTGTGLTTDQDVDTFMRLLPQGFNISHQDVAKVCAAAFYDERSQLISIMILQTLTLPTPALSTSATDASHHLALA